MDFASIQDQLANLTSQLSQYAERTTMQSVPTFGASYRQEYQANQRSQRDWSDHSNSMWYESQQVQHEGYWQPYEESIQVLRSHHNLIYNMPKQTQVRQ